MGNIFGDMPQQYDFDFLCGRELFTWVCPGRDHIISYVIIDGIIVVIGMKELTPTGGSIPEQSA